MPRGRYCATSAVATPSRVASTGRLARPVIDLARASRGDLGHIVLIGEIHPDSVFQFRPLVQRVPTVKDWFAQLH